MSQAIDKCPVCKAPAQLFIYGMIDGGSIYCMKCTAYFHICKGTIQFGSPGPDLCAICRPDNRHLLLQCNSSK